MGSINTTRLNGWETWVVRVDHSSPHGSSKSRSDKSRSACSGNAQTNGLCCTTRPTLFGIFTKSPEQSKTVQLISDSTLFKFCKTPGRIQISTQTKKHIRCTTRIERVPWINTNHIKAGQSKHIGRLPSPPP